MVVYLCTCSFQRSFAVRTPNSFKMSCGACLETNNRMCMVVLFVLLFHRHSPHPQMLSGRLFSERSVSLVSTSHIPLASEQLGESKYFFKGSLCHIIILMQLLLLSFLEETNL